MGLEKACSDFFFQNLQFSEHVYTEELWPWTVKFNEPVFSYTFSKIAYTKGTNFLCFHPSVSKSIFINLVHNKKHFFKRKKKIFLNKISYQLRSCITMFISLMLPASITSIEFQFTKPTFILFFRMNDHVLG